MRKDELNTHYENLSDRYRLTFDLNTKTEVVREVSSHESVHQSKGGKKLFERNLLHIKETRMEWKVV